jgi:hypothetical protein
LRIPVFDTQTSAMSLLNYKNTLPPPFCRSLSAKLGVRKLWILVPGPWRPVPA